MVKASFVVPVYKIQEEYLRECIESIRNQTIRDIEIILIDDGSPDKCGEICDEYAAKDKRIISIHQPNQGVSVARNCGMNKATGEVILFVDSDDWVDKDYTKIMVDGIEKNNSDIVLCGYKSVRAKKSECHLIGSDILYHENKIKEIQLGILNPSGDSLFNIPASPWAKAFRTKFIKKNNLHYVPGIKRMQDNIFCFDAYEKVKKIQYINYCGYYWRANENSVCFKYNPSIINISEEVLEQFKLRIVLHSDSLFMKTYLCKVIHILFGEYMRSYFRHNDNKKEMRIKIAELRALCSNEPYKSAIANVDTRLLGKKYALMTILARIKAYRLLWEICNIKENIDLLRYRGNIIR